MPVVGEAADLGRVRTKGTFDTVQRHLGCVLGRTGEGAGEALLGLMRAVLQEARSGCRKENGLLGDRGGGSRVARVLGCGMTSPLE